MAPPGCGTVARTDHLVVMAAGRGTRMDPLTRTRPKVLLPVAGRPIVEHLLRRAAEAGFRRATLIVHEGADLVRAAFGEGTPLGLRIEYVDQGGTGGTGHAVAALAGHVTEDFVLVSGDSVLDAEDLRHLAAARGDAVGAKRVEDARPFGLLAVEDGRVTGIEEKPTEARPGLVNTGAYRFTPEIALRCADLRVSPRGERELTDAVAGLAAEGAPAHVVETPSWQEAGRPWDLLALQERLMAGLKTRIDGDVGERVDLVGPVVVEAGARVLNGTRVEGPVWIGAGATVGPGAYLRPATAVGPRCHVGASVEIKNAILGEGSNVPHLSYVGDSVIGEGCNLGAGTQVANLKVSDRNVRVLWKGRDWIDTGRRKLGAIMADGVRTGVNCSIDPGTVLCPGLRVGAGQVLSGWQEVEPL